MKQTLKKLFALIVCLSLCAGVVLPIAAANESNTRGYEFTATASQATIDATEDTTVTVTISANTPITANSYQFFFITLPEGFEVASVEDLAGFSTAIDMDAQKTFVTWVGNDQVTDETAVGNDIVAITYNIAAGTAPGEYTLGVQEMFLDDYDMSKYETSAIASTTVTIANGTVVTGDSYVTSTSLILKGMIEVKSYITFDEVLVNGEALTDGLSAEKNMEYILENGGMLTWLGNSMPANPEDAVIGTEDYVSALTYSGVYKENDEYSATSGGIPSWNYADTIYMRPYVIIDGEYVYGTIKEYSVLTYCTNMIKKDTTKETLKSVIAGLLNYGAEAQTYFSSDASIGIDLNNLANKDLNDWVDAGYLDASYLDLNWSDDYLTALVEPSEEMTANFASTGTLTSTGKSLILKGAISVKYYISVGSDQSNFTNAEKKMYFWTATDYAAIEAAGEILTKENASYVIDGTEFVYGGTNYGYETSATSEGIYAMNYGDTLYSVMCITDNSGVEHISDFIIYSPETYAANKLTNEKTETVDPVCQWLVAYGERAKLHFAS